MSIRLIFSWFLAVVLVGLLTLISFSHYTVQSQNSEIAACGNSEFLTLTDSGLKCINSSALFDPAPTESPGQPRPGGTCAKGYTVGYAEGNFFKCEELLWKWENDTIISKYAGALQSVKGGKFSGTGFYYTSDRNAKENIQKIGNPSEKLQNINGYSFTYKESGEKSIGVVAQEVERVFPELVQTDNDGMKQVDYPALTGLLIESIKELQTQVDKQDAELQALRALIGG